MSNHFIPASEHTRINLELASCEESNSSVRYTIFARKADQEGFLKVGSLFRAVARSEQILSANNTATGLKMGSTHQCKIELPEAGSTVENLKDALSGEAGEVLEEIPGFIRDAEQEAQFVARRTLKYAIATQRGHIQLFRDALEKIEHPHGKWNEILSLSGCYYVCLVCGLTTDQAKFDRCPSCGHSRDEFEMVS